MLLSLMSLEIGIEKSPGLKETIEMTGPFIFAIFLEISIDWSQEP